MPRLLSLLLALGLLLSLPPGTLAAPPDEHLPPVLPWDGPSRALVVEPDHPWITPVERSGLTATPRYDETVAWLERLVSASPELHMVSIGRSLEGRDVWMIVASRERAFTPKALRATGKPTLFAQAAIHSGEIDGKDAGMMLLRDMTVRGTKRDLLDGANLLFVPILSPDGHERFSAHARINQRGPAEMGWRTNGRNLNLNRDYAKLDTPEVRAAVRVIEEWKPELYFDLHVTDGIDYQYDITFGWVGENGYSPNAARWLDQTFRPEVSKALDEAGHIPGPLVFAAASSDLERGIVDFMAGPRYSNTWGDLRHQPTVLVENHSLKPFDQRVLGTYVLLESTMRLLAREGAPLRKAIAQDEARRPDSIPVTWRVGETPQPIDFLGISYEIATSEISGQEYVRWTGEPRTMRIPYIKVDTPDLSIERAHAYWVPANWPDVIERLAAHGIRLEYAREPVDVEVDLYRLAEAEVNATPFEGRVLVTTQATLERHRRRYPAGSVRVPMDQPLGDLATVLLEPLSPDSFFQWGFFLEILQRTEYAEAYAMEPLARRMLENDPALRREFEAAIASDAELAGDPQARLEWLYRRTPYYDREYLLYPVGREIPAKSGESR